MANGNKRCEFGGVATAINKASARCCGRLQMGIQSFVAPLWGYPLLRLSFSQRCFPFYHDSIYVAGRVYLQALCIQIHNSQALCIRARIQALCIEIHNSQALCIITRSQVHTRAVWVWHVCIIRGLLARDVILIHGHNQKQIPLLWLQIYADFLPTAFDKKKNDFQDIEKKINEFILTQKKIIEFQKPYS